jgi:hypothetical protein
VKISRSRVVVHGSLPFGRANFVVIARREQRQLGSSSRPRDSRRRRSIARCAPSS